MIVRIDVNNNTLFGFLKGKRIIFNEIGKEEKRKPKYLRLHRTM